MRVFQVTWGVGVVRVMEDMVAFLTTYSWVFHWKVTRVLADDVLASVPPAWRTYMEAISLAQFDSVFLGRGEGAPPPPPDVRRFIEWRRRLVASSEVVQGEVVEGALSKVEGRGVGRKKEHEVANMGKLVEEECMRAGVGHVVDVGCGLGYLGEELVRGWEQW